jgi:hypothetical protein
MALQRWVADTRKLLAIEHDEEIAQSLETLMSSDTRQLVERGVTLLNMKVSDTSTGLFGRTVVTLCDWMERLLPANKLSVGDIVGLRTSRDASAKHAFTGIITSVGEFRVALAVDERGGEDGGGGGVDVDGELPDRVRIDLLANEITYNRLCAGLSEIESWSLEGPSRVAAMSVPALCARAPDAASCS